MVSSASVASNRRGTNARKKGTTRTSLPNVGSMLHGLLPVVNSKATSPNFDATNWASWPSQQRWALPTKAPSPPSNL